MPSQALRSRGNTPPHVAENPTTEPSHGETRDLGELRPFDGYEIGPEELDFRRSRRIRSSVLAAIGLDIGGLFLLFLGLAMYSAGHERIDWTPAVILGTLCLIPGLYASYLAYGAYRNWRGFSWESIPAYQEVE